MLNIIKVYVTCFKFYLKGVKPTIHRKIGKNGQKGYFLRMGTGGKSGEPLLRVNMGNYYSSFPMYDRKGKTRVNPVVPIKTNYIHKKVS